MIRPPLSDPAYLDHCARAVAQLLRTRVQRLPRSVEVKAITQAAADRSIELAEALDRQWRWAIDGTKPPRPAWNERTGYFGAYCFELAADVDRAVERQRAAAAKSGDGQAEQLADLYAAVAWWQHPPTGAPKSGDCRIIIYADQGRPAERQS